MSMPNRVGQFLVGERIGTGSFAVVWKAEDKDIPGTVAIKVLQQEWAQRIDVRNRFVQEAEMLRKANSSRVVDVYVLGELPDGRPYFVMTYASGGSLEDLLRAGGALPAEQALRIGAEVARGVAELHAAGVVHRDIKPANVLFRSPPYTGAPRVLIADLGLARYLARGSRFTLPAGTAGYMAPEHDDPGSAPVDGRADIYSVGATIRHALTGAPPGIGSNSRLPAGVRRVLDRAQALDPADRWASADELAGELDALAARSAAARPPGRRWMRPAAVVAVAIVALVAVLGLRTLWSGRSAGPSAGVAGAAVPAGTTSRATATSATATSASATSASTPGIDQRLAPGQIPNCAGTIVKPHYVERDDGSAVRLGAIQLCRDAAYRYWAYLVLYEPLPAGRWANGYLERLDHGHVDTFSCRAVDNGASGPILPGEQLCVSPKVAGTNDSLIFRARAGLYTGGEGDLSHPYARGLTVRAAAGAHP